MQITVNNYTYNSKIDENRADCIMCFAIFI